MEKENSTDKVKLIYEFNNDSPLFARVAEDELNNGNFEKAIAVLVKGLENFPDYATAYFLYGKALAYGGDYEKAKDTISKGSNFIDSEETKNFYLDEIKKIKEREDYLSKSRRVPFFGEEFEDKIKEDTDSTDEKVDGNLDNLAQKLEGAKIKFDPQSDDNYEFEEEPDEETDDQKIVSETLGGIYLSQGNYKEALKIYKKLLEQKPEKAEEFEKKINYIQKLMEQAE